MRPKSSNRARWAAFVPRGRLYRAALALGLCAVLAAGGLWAFVPDPVAGVVRWPVSPVLLDNRGSLIHARLSSDGEWCLPVPLTEMGAWLPKILVEVEDKRFYAHPGVDVLALGRALGQNLLSGRVVSGASTITSQLVRLSEPRQRTIGVKILEFAGAVKLERHLTKEQILELYLNRAPFGGPIRGVEAAARQYFGKRAKELSLGEAALLIGLLKGPTAYRPDRNPKAALARRQKIIRQAALSTDFPPDLTRLALEEPLPRFRPVMPARAWHFADIAFQTLPVDGERKMGGVVRSTLDSRIQHLLERTLEETLAGLSPEVTAAAVVVDNRTASVVAYVGNARFDPAGSREWVDCAKAPRSPGSTLKPFVYLAALEKGHIIPTSLLADTPMQLGGEAPRNFDRTYRGPVTAAQALADSLNTPAVRVLRMVGLRAALRMFHEAGFTLLDRINHDYGDSLVLGAGEVSLMELARAYTALANLGVDRPLFMARSPHDLRAEGRVPLEAYGSSLEAPSPGGEDGPATLSARFFGPRPTFGGEWGPVPSGFASGEDILRGNPEQRLYTEAASFLIADILKDPGRLPFIVQLLQARDRAPIAFKTGTSYGLRDAWTAAYTPAHTLVVWFGRANGGADANLLGISLAAPVALRVLRGLNPDRPVEDSWYIPPPTVERVAVCGLSGAAPSPFCPVTRMAWHIPSVWRTVPCSLHVMKDGKPSLAWPPEFEDYRRKRLAREDLSRAISIVSPRPHAQYLLTPGAPLQPLPLRAEGVAYPVHWYDNGAYLGEQPDEDDPVYFTLTPGDHHLSALDARDRTTSLKVTVVDLAARMQSRELPLLGE